MIKLSAGAATDVGAVRTENQDEFKISDHAFIVADGMGGHLGGEVASSLAVEAFSKSLPSNAVLTTDNLISAARAANKAVFERAQSDVNVKGMGTTLTALTEITHDDERRIAVVHIGDSRAYLFRDGILQQITNDHSWVEDMVRTGQLTPSEAGDHPRRNILTRALGVDATLEPDVVQILPLMNDRYLLCSDGLVRELTDDQIASVLRRLADPTEAARDLVSRAKDSGGQDNITALIVDVVESDIDAEAIARDATSSPNIIKTNVEPEKSDKGKRSGTMSAETHSPSKPILTTRVVAFFIALIVLVGAAIVVLYSYATNSYFVTTKANEVVIYKGRPGGSLGMKPKLAEHTYKVIGQIPPAHRDEIKKGKVFASKSDAEAYVSNLVGEAAILGITPESSPVTSATGSTIPQSQTDVSPPPEPTGTP